MCVCVLRGTVLLILYVRARVCVKKGGVKEDSHFWFGLRRVTGTWSSSGMLYWNNLLWPQTGAHRLSACLLMTCSLLLFFIIYFSLLQWNFIEGWKAFSSCCVTSWKQALVSVALVRLLMLWMRCKSLWLALCMADCLTSSFYLAFQSCIRYIQYIWKKVMI